MIECGFKLSETGAAAQAKLVLREADGKMEWEYTTVLYERPQTGSVKPERSDYLLIGEERLVGRLKNFSLRSYNPRIIYRLDFAGREYRCEISDAELKN